MMCMGMLAILTVWIARDLSVSSRHSLRDFDPNQVARLETDAWRSYYAHEKLHLFRQMVELFRSEYHMPFWRSCLAAYYAAHAAVVFQPGHNRAEYERALPDLVRLFTLVRKGSETDFPVHQVAQLELEWWIVHRERAQRPPGSLERALAAEQAVLYQQPESLFEDHAKARAEAMTVRDTHADWVKIRALLNRSWTSLRSSVTALS